MAQTTIPWTIEIVDLQTQSRVGIWEHERALQPLRITLSIRAVESPFPCTIDDCLDYERICRWLLDEWPRQPHTPLMETRVRELMDFVFGNDERVEWAHVAIFKTAAIAQVGAVGVRAMMSRSGYDASFGSRVALPFHEGDGASLERCRCSSR